MSTTQTGIPVVSCRDCGSTHPATRHHCESCGRATTFLDARGHCLTCCKTTSPEPFELLEPTYDQEGE